MKILLLSLLFLFGSASIINAQVTCENPILNNVFYSPTPTCDSLGTTLNIAGLLKDATAWHIYEGSCGGTLVGTTTGASFIFYPDTTKLYYVRGEGGCVTPGVCDTLTIQVVKLAPIVQVDSNVMCNRDSTGGASVTVTGGLAPYRYSWSNGSTNSFITGVPAGTYTVSISDANDCFKNRSITISEHLPIKDTLPVATICNGDSIAIFGSFKKISGYYYDTNQSIFSCDSITVQELIVNPVHKDTLASVETCLGDSVLIFGSYRTTSGYYDSSVTVFGCDSVTVQELLVNSPSALTVNDTICKGDSIQIKGNWYTAEITLNDTMVGANSTGCDSVITYTVIVDTVSPTLNLGLDISTCGHTVVPLVAPTGYASYTWSSGGTTNTENIDGATYGIGSFTIWLDVTDASTGCIASDTINVDFYNCVGIELNETEAFLAYPNPATGKVNLIFNQKESGIVSVVDVNGSVVYEQVINNKNTCLLDLTAVSKGIYILVFNTKNGTLSKRLSIK